MSPTYEQAKQQYRRCVGMLGPCWEVLLKKNQTELRVKFINQSEIIFKSGEVLHNLRGESLNGVVEDEVRDQSPELWTQVLRPMLATTNGWAIFVSTPSGFDSFYDLFQMAEAHADWESFKAPSTANPGFTQAEFEAAKAVMTEDEFAQEILAEFREIGKGKAYLNHGAHNYADQNPFAPQGQKWSPFLPIIVGLDFNVGIMAWQLLQHKGEDFYNGDEISLSNTHTQDMAPLLVEKVKGHKPGVILIGDASGKSGHTSAAGATDYSIIMKALREANIPARNLTTDSNPHVKDRVNLMNSRLKAADGSVHYWYNQKVCKHLRKDLERVSWKQNALGAILDKSNPLLTHASDSASYPVAYYAEELRNRPGVLRVIPR